MSILRPLRARAAAALLLASPAAAQQFVAQTNLFPGTARWSEGVECADIDNDGDLDVFFAEGDGFSTAGAARQNRLYVNQLVPSGTLSFTDESVARLGANSSNAKAAVTADVNGDGWVDVLYVNAFNLQTPYLYINQGATNPGHFTLESATRGLTEALNASGAQFGDLDDDGDLDLVIVDSGSSLLGGGGGKPRLYWNDGAGNFTEESGAGWNPSTKRAHMDVQLCDIDGDFDLDFLGACRASNAGGNHYLLVNEGGGTFTEQSGLLPSTSSNCYELEVGDLDGDTDLDLFFVSLSGFAEGAVRNELSNGTLSFATIPGNLGGDDDNEVVLFDADDDGDYDAFIGSLGSREKLWRNNGDGTFANATTEVQAVSDPTLDLTAADLDNDGDYDLISSQGEGFPQSAWTNKVYRNDGPADSRAPIVVAETAAEAGGALVAKARVRDAVRDDAKDWVRGTAHYVVGPLAGPVGVALRGQGPAPDDLAVAAGTRVSFTNHTGAPVSVVGTTAPWTFDSGDIAPGASWSRVFVRPGVYDYEVTGGATGSVTVSGSATSADGLRMGGDLHRFALPAGVAIAWELEFVDWAGNTGVGEAHRVDPTLGSTVCFGDGSVGLCPCGNTSAPGAEQGCRNSTGVGATLLASGSVSVANDDLVLHAAGARPNQPGMMLQGVVPTALSFKDGMLCVGSPTERLEVVLLDADGAGSSTGSIVTAGAVQPGFKRTYQFWYRDPALSPCGTGSNFSSALIIDWL